MSDEWPHANINHSQLESEFDDVAKDSIVDDFLDSARGMLTGVSGFDQPTVYVNFAHGDEGPAAWYGQHNIEKLVTLKRKWDPQGLFSFYNAIPLDNSVAVADEL